MILSREPMSASREVVSPAGNGAVISERNLHELIVFIPTVEKCDAYLCQCSWAVFECP